MSGEPRKGTFKVQFLKDIEKTIQARWEENHAYEENAPDDLTEENVLQLMRQSKFFFSRKVKL